MVQVSPKIFAVTSGSIAQVSPKIFAVTNDSVPLKVATLFFDVQRNVITEVNLQIDTGRATSEVIGYSSQVDCIRYITNGPTPFTNYHDTARSCIPSFSFYNDVSANVLTRENTIVDTNRKTTGKFIFEVDTAKNVQNDTYKTICSSIDMLRIVHRELSMTKGICDCKEIDLGATYEIEVGINVDGEGYAEISYANENCNFSEYADYTPGRITCRYIRVRLVVIGRVNSADITLISPPKEVTVTKEVPSDGANILFGVNFYTEPLVFPATSQFNVNVSDITKSGCFVKLKNEKGEPCSGTVSLLVKG